MLVRHAVGDGGWFGGGGSGGAGVGCGGVVAGCVLGGSVGGGHGFLGSGARGCAPAGGGAGRAGAGRAARDPPRTAQMTSASVHQHADHRSMIQANPSAPIRPPHPTMGGGAVPLRCNRWVLRCGFRVEVWGWC
ncbi:hypothetical protein RSA5_07490 [Rothia kristinae]|nr:hypothetical protein RSA5_07490 [Rothia kristinae]